MQINVLYYCKCLQEGKMQVNVLYYCICLQGESKMLVNIFITVYV